MALRRTRRRTTAVARRRHPGTRQLAGHALHLHRKMAHPPARHEADDIPAERKPDRAGRRPAVAVQSPDSRRGAGRTHPRPHSRREWRSTHPRYCEICETLRHQISLPAGLSADFALRHRRLRSGRQTDSVSERVSGGSGDFPPGQAVPPPDRLRRDPA